MTTRHSWIAMIAFVSLVLCACGDGGGGDHAAGSPRIPGRDDPAFGTVGNVLVSDFGTDLDGHRDEIWIGFNSQQNWDGFIAGTKYAMASGGLVLLIGGKLVADLHHHLGFYFDPDTVSAAEVTIIDAQTSIDILKSDPKRAEQTPFKTWVIPCDYREGCKP